LDELTVPSQTPSVHATPCAISVQENQPHRRRTRNNYETATRRSDAAETRYTPVQALLQRFLRLNCVRLRVPSTLEAAGHRTTGNSPALGN